MFPTGVHADRIARKEAGKEIFIYPSSVQRKDQKANAALQAGGYWGYLAYAQSGLINNGEKGKFRANLGFVDGHVELRRSAPRPLFTLERD